MCMFCSTWIWSAPPPKPDIPTRRPDKPRLAAHPARQTAPKPVIQNHPFR
ncbi:protein DedD [Escherichia coli MS 79-10]|nr:protein DedD [Escherichia coli MS 79-10]